ncbi:MAG: D-2-hydroxyacid dehydrogenase [Thermomicrobiales bacterium]|nr:D-2-hydroxyacid dehydrogenase [Thermomicrobiales bacterium]MCO5222687.1 D-2-hydroxyacid dehydrogenase [Thermomicrobiales bacterium]
MSTLSESSTTPVVIGITSPLEPEHVERIRNAAPGRIDVRYAPDLLPPARYVADHEGPDGWTRSPRDQARWEAMLAECDVVWDIPEVVWDTPGATTKPVLEILPKLRWIQTTSAGVGPMITNLGLADTDILVTTSSGIHAKPLAEFAFAVMLTWVKELPRLRDDQRAHRWERYCAGELDGRTLTVVGPGRIGREVGRLGKAFGMRTIAVASRVDPERSQSLGFDQVFDRSGLHAALGQSDFVVLSTPHTPDTENLIDAAAIAAMKPGIVLVNIARGIVIDEDAMIEALRSGQIAFAGLDVFRTEPLPTESPLWEMPNVLIAPHSASTAWSENQRITDIFVRNIPLFLEGRYDEMSPLLDKQRGY